MNSSKQRQWTGKTGGGHFGQQTLFKLLRCVPVRFIYPILLLVVPFYLLFGKQGRKAIYAFYRQRLGQNALHASWNTLRTHYTFGKVVLDKFALLAGNVSQFVVSVDNEALMQSLLQAPQGMILASAHIGNLEMSGFGIHQESKKIYGIIFGGETEDYQRQRMAMFGQHGMELIPVSDDLSHLFRLKQVLDEGHIAVLPCDRVLGSSKATMQPFLGSNALFPIGTFRLAAQLEVPLVCLFVLKGRGNKYMVHTKLLKTLSNEPSSAKQAEHLAVQYVQFLEQTVREHPTQWFNFFNFWKI